MLQAPTYRMEDIGLLLSIIKDDTVSYVNLVEHIGRLREMRSVVEIEKDCYQDIEYTLMNIMLTETSKALLEYAETLAK